MIQLSSRASPGGSSALRTRCTRRSELVTVPSASHHDAGRGQHDVGELGGLGQVDVLHDQAVQPVAAARGRAGRRPRTGPGSRRSRTACAARRAPLPRTCRSGASRTSATIGVPQACSNRSRASSSCSMSWKPGQLVRDRAHVAAALDVVLPAQRVQPRAVAPDVPGQQRQVDQRQHVVDRVVVLGDPERPADDRPVGARVGVRELADRFGRARPSAARPRSSVYGSTDSANALEALGRARDEAARRRGRSG